MYWDVTRPLGNFLDCVQPNNLYWRNFYKNHKMFKQISQYTAYWKNFTRET